MTKNAEVQTTPENTALAAREIYLAFLANMQERADGEIGKLTDLMAKESDTEKLLALQQDLRRARRRYDVLCRLRSGIRPFTMEEIVAEIADPEVRRELQPIFDTLVDLREALGMLGDDLRREARHE